MCRNKGVKEVVEKPIIIGISRGSLYSPNHVDNDAAVFNSVVEELRKLGCRVDTYTESEFVAQGIKADNLFSMARDRATIGRLKELEDAGSLVINSAYGIDNCVRKAMTEKLLASGIPHPASWILNLNEVATISFDYPCWVKRGDSHAMVKEDVCYVTNDDELNGVFADFRQRGIPTAVINEHLKGDLIKFYGLRGLDFFYWFYPSPCSHSKFGLEKINGEASGISFDPEQLKAYCERASVVLDVPVYGGDCVVLSNGEMKIIDFNDWPSFARCRDEAGTYIASYIYKEVIIRKV